MKKIKKIKVNEIKMQACKVNYNSKECIKLWDIQYYSNDTKKNVATKLINIPILI